jgi:hypothetical protein
MNRELQIVYDSGTVKTKVGYEDTQDFKKLYFDELKKDAIVRINIKHASLKYCFALV